ncbi:hypothetical protein AURDEDRAFT_172677 [Auricularia subglabra TFB-10046 SS5]|nr:hypothetical protein AURDEDRAFT_172677 [Auricularia subglabra TFB-10046 SS5]
MPPTRGNNPGGKNGHGTSALTMWPELPDLIRQCMRDGFTEPRILDHLKTKGISISGSTLDRIKRKFQLPSVRRNPMSDAEIAQAVFQKAQDDDPRGAIGTENFKLRLSKEEGVFVAKPMLRHLLKNWDPEATDKRNPKIGTKKHKHGIWSAGPGEEWAFDQHEKLVPEMNIGVYGAIDKWSRSALMYKAVSRWRQRDVGSAIFVLCVQQEGGFPVTTHTDMGPETTDMCRIQIALREEHNPVLDIQELPPHVFTDSWLNIIKEQKWKDVFRKDLANVLDYFQKRNGVPYEVDNAVHVALARWIWAQAVQLRLDQYVERNNVHRIRKNNKTLLPSGVSPMELMADPSKYNGTNLLTPLPKDQVNGLVQDYVPHDIFQFGTDEEVQVYEVVFRDLQCPAVHWTNAWQIFMDMLPVVQTYFV